MKEKSVANNPSIGNFSSRVRYQRLPCARRIALITGRVLLGIRERDT